jgi:hypothetical protein
MSFSTQFASEPTQWDEDKATLSNYQEVRTDHIDLDWSIDWKKQVIHGGDAEVKWSHGERIGAMGEGLKIELKDQLKKGQVRLAASNEHVARLISRHS